METSRTLEEILLNIEERMLAQLDDLERRVAALETHSDQYSDSIDTLTDILDRLTRDDAAVVGRTRQEVRIDRDTAYRAFDRAGISRRRALRELADRGYIRLEHEPRTRRFTPKVRVGTEVTRCVVAIIREVGT